MTSEKPAHIARFEHIEHLGRGWYVLRTACMVAALIAVIQWFSVHTFEFKSILGYGFVGACLAQADWLILRRRYRKHHTPEG